MLSGREAELVRLVEQLQPLVIHSLRITLHTELEAAAQRQWAKLSIQHRVDILVCKSQVLMAAPQCACLQFSLGACEEAPHVVVIPWAVLSSCIGASSQGAMVVSACPILLGMLRIVHSLGSCGQIGQQRILWTNSQHPRVAGVYRTMPQRQQAGHEPVNIGQPGSYGQYGWVTRQPFSLWVGRCNQAWCWCLTETRMLWQWYSLAHAAYGTSAPFKCSPVHSEQ